MRQPLADAIRPEALEDVVGQEHLLGEGAVLRRLIERGMEANMVADSARAVVLSQDKAQYEPIRDKAARWKDEGRADIATKIIGKSMEIKVKGRPAHGSTPEKGINAVSLLMRFLEDINFNVDEVNDFISFYNTCLGMETGRRNSTRRPGR